MGSFCFSGSILLPTFWSGCLYRLLFVLSKFYLSVCTMTTRYSDGSSLPLLYLSLRSSVERPGFNEFPSDTLHFLRDGSDGWSPFTPSRGALSDPRRSVGLDLFGVRFSRPQDSPLPSSLGVRLRVDSSGLEGVGSTPTACVEGLIGSVSRSSKDLPYPFVRRPNKLGEVRSSLVDQGSPPDDARDASRPCFGLGSSLVVPSTEADSDPLPYGSFGRDLLVTVPEDRRGYTDSVWLMPRGDVSVPSSMAPLDVRLGARNFERLAPVSFLCSLAFLHYFCS